MDIRKVKTTPSRLLLIDRQQLPLERRDDSLSTRIRGELAKRVDLKSHLPGGFGGVAELIEQFNQPLDPVRPTVAGPVAHLGEHRMQTNTHRLEHRIPRAPVRQRRSATPEADHHHDQQSQSTEHRLPM